MALPRASQWVWIKGLQTLKEDVSPYLPPEAPSSQFRSKLGTNCWTKPSVRNNLLATAGITGNTAAAAENAKIKSSFVCLEALDLMKSVNSCSPLSFVASNNFEVASIAWLRRGAS